MTPLDCRLAQSIAILQVQDPLAPYILKPFQGRLMHFHSLCLFNKEKLKELKAL